MNKQLELGQYMTPDSIADEMCSRIKRPVEEWKVLDPACGDGNLLLAAARRMKQAGVSDIHARLIGIDIDPEMVGKTKRILAKFIGCDINLLQVKVGDFLQVSQIGLFSNGQSIAPNEFNIVISNPPYGHQREYSFFNISNSFSNTGTELIFLVPLAFLDRVENITYTALDGRPLGVTTGHAIVYHIAREPYRIKSIYGLEKNNCSFRVLSGIKLYEEGAGQPLQTKETLTDKPFSSNIKRPGWLPCIRTGDIQPFRIFLGRLWVNYGPHLAHPKDIERFTGPRLFIRRMPIWKNRQLGSAYIEEVALCAGDILVIRQDENDHELLKGLCIYLNSQEAAIAVLERRPSLKYRTSFPKLSAKDLNQLIELDAPKENKLRELAKNGFRNEIVYSNEVIN